MKKITLEGGIEVRTFAPSKDFNPLKATPAQLVANGFPTMPDDPKLRERYVRVWNRIKSRFNYVEPTFRVNSDRIHGPRKGLAAERGEMSYNWSGGVVGVPEGQAFNLVLSDWTIPGVATPTNPQTGQGEPGWHYCSSWVGIDGDRGSADVFQAGVECQVYGTLNGHGEKHVTYAWWEWAPLPEVEITNFGVQPGDRILVILCANEGHGPTTQGTAFMANITTGQYMSYAMNAPSGTRLIGNCAEWIVERPEVGGVTSPLADYGEIIFDYCVAGTDGGLVVNADTGDTIQMTAGRGIISVGELISSQNLVDCTYFPADPDGGGGQ
jgi:Peptidase A4 family